jgi:hypothetical protein
MNRTLQDEKNTQDHLPSAYGSGEDWVVLPDLVDLDRVMVDGGFFY